LNKGYELPEIGTADTDGALVMGYHASRSDVYADHAALWCLVNAYYGLQQEFLF
jgi:hypothetical protein